MKYLKRTQIYKSPNVSFNPKTKEAYSYLWWRFVGVIEGKVVFNNYRYSVTTAKHQRKVSSLINELGIKIDLSLQIPGGLQTVYSLTEAIQIAEETLCDQYLDEEAKKEDRNAKSKIKRLKNKLTDYLENSVHFRDYDIADRKDFGNPNALISSKIAVHQVVDAESLEQDVENALYNFHRDGFGSIVFYVGGAQ